jgi:selenocysteine lyase/cysteine desulfurase
MDRRTEKLLGSIRRGIIGDDRAVVGPFGTRRVTYADYTASGRSLDFIEDFIRHEVMPLYANTHTETSTTGLQTTRFREDARRLILESVGGGAEDVLIFCGSGATGAINKLIGILNLRVPADLDSRFGLTRHIPASERPVVFIGPYEHHSNEIPWRESIADVVTIAEDSDGQIDLEHLEAALEDYRERPLKIGSFSAASNVTGIVSDAQEITRRLHEHGALAFWDFAAAAPYVHIEMNPEGGDGPDPDLSMDAVFISPHKFIGGPGTPGVLVVKRRLVTNRVPTVPGGGTVSYVNEFDHSYVSDLAQREEGGTPAIIESIRAGLVFHLKRAVGEDVIEELEQSFVTRAIDSWSANSKIHILGNRSARRLSIVSFLIRHGERYLHHNFVVALLNDLFGIQARGGCSCAGPYGHRLLGIDLDHSSRFKMAINSGCEGIKPGWVRVNFNYFIPEEIFRFLVEAVQFIAEDGWKLLPLYIFEAETGLWLHRERPQQAALGLDNLSYLSGELAYASVRLTEPISVLERYLEEAKDLAEGMEPDSTGSQGDETLSVDLESLRWFPLP